MSAILPIEGRDSRMVWHSRRKPRPTGPECGHVCGGIHMSDVPAFPYRLLWEERVIRSVANLTRRDAEEFLALAPAAGIRITTQTYPLAGANQALADLRHGAVLVPQRPLSRNAGDG